MGLYSEFHEIDFETRLPTENLWAAFFHHHVWIKLLNMNLSCMISGQVPTGHIKTRSTIMSQRYISKLSLYSSFTMVLIVVLSSPYLQYDDNSHSASLFIYPDNGEVATASEVCPWSLFCGRSLNMVRQQPVSASSSTLNFSSNQQFDKKPKLENSFTEEMPLLPSSNLMTEGPSQAATITPPAILEARVAPRRTQRTNKPTCPGYGQKLNRKHDAHRHWDSTCPEGPRRIFSCPEPGCSKAYSRVDAVKRHQRESHGGMKRQDNRRGHGARRKMN